MFLALITISKAGITFEHAAQYPVVPNNLHIMQQVRHLFHERFSAALPEIHWFKWTRGKVAVVNSDR